MEKVIEKHYTKNTTDIIVKGDEMAGIVGFAGSFSQPSRTRSFVQTAVDDAAHRAGLRGLVFDLGDLGASLGTAKRIDDLGLEARKLVESLLAADAIVVGSPVYKGSYTGLFKHLFDLIDPDALRGKPVLLTATGGGHRHALVIEHQLRPLFGFFESAVVSTGVYAASADLEGGVVTSPEIVARLRTAVGQLVGALKSGREVDKPVSTAA
jgi:FMN reductase